MFPTLTIVAILAPPQKTDVDSQHLQVSCEPTSQKDADKLGEALNKLAAEVWNP